MGDHTNDRLFISLYYISIFTQMQDKVYS